MDWLSEVPERWFPLAMMVVNTALLSAVFLRFWKINTTHKDALIDKLLAALKDNAEASREFARVREEKMLEVLSHNTESRVVAAGKWEMMTEAINRLMNSR